MDTLDTRKTSRPCWESNHDSLVVQHIPQSPHNNYATLAPTDIAFCLFAKNIYNKLLGHRMYTEHCNKFVEMKHVHYVSLCEFINVKTQGKMIQKMKDKAGTHLQAYTMPQTAVRKHKCITSRIHSKVENVIGMEKTISSTDL